jgi:hypothetical protein
VPPHVLPITPAAGAITPASSSGSDGI